MNIKISDKNYLNKGLSFFNNYFPHIPMEKINALFECYGYLLIQEDYTKFEGFFCGEVGHTTIQLGVLQTGVSTGIFQEVKNTLLSLSWYKMPSGNFEIVTYLT